MGCSERAVRPSGSSRTLWMAVAIAMIAASITPTSGVAQDMEFNVEETGQPPAPPAEGPPSEALANALRLYQQERYQEAAVQFQRVVEGETQDAAANVQKAQFFLGKCLYHLRYYQSALAIFDEIGQMGAGHLYFDQTLQWLAQLASQLPEPAGIIEKVGRYGVDQLDQFNTTETAELYNELLYIMGRYKYDQQEFEEANELFGRVATDSSFFIKAKFFEGISHIRMRRARPAIASFRSIVEAIDEGNVEGVEDEERMNNLAWISLARLYYTAANSTDPETGERRARTELAGSWGDPVFRDGGALALHQSIDHPARLTRVADGAILADPNADSLAGLTLGAVTEHTFAGARGDDVQLFVVDPPDAPAGPLPLVHMIHGGPHGTFGDVFHFRWNAHAFAAGDYRVALVNFHGSTSFGHESTRSIHGAWGEMPAEDILRATDWLVERGLADPERMAITGGSYGGYLAAWIPTLTSRFRCAIAHAAVTDLGAIEAEVDKIIAAKAV